MHARPLSRGSASAGPRWTTLLEALQNDPAQRRKRWLTTLAGAGGLAVVGAGYRAWLPDPSEPCRGTMQRLDGVWDDARHEQVRMAMTGIGTSYATPAWERAERGLNDYAEAWASMRTEACEATTIRGEQSPHLLDLRMVCLDRARVELGAVVDVLADADAEVVLRAHKVVDALPPLSGCADIEALGAEVQPPRQADESVVDQARARLARSKSLDEAGRYDAALTAVHGAAALIDGIDYGPIQTEVALRRGITLTHLGQLEDAETALQDTLYRSVRWKQWPEMQSAVAVLMYVVGHQQKRFEEALQYRVLAEGLAHGNPRAEASLHLAASSVLLAQGDYAEAEAEARQGVAKRQEAYGREHPEVAAARTHLASILFRQGNYEDAEAEYRAAIEAKTANLGPTHPVLGTSRNGLSMVLRRQGRLAEAEAELRRALALWESAFGPEHHHVLGARSNLANLLGLQGRHAEAETAHRAVLAARVATVGPDHPDTANTRNNLAHTLQLQGKLDEAEAELRAALEIVLDALGPDHPTVAAFRGNVALFLHDQQRFDEALPLAEASWARRQRDDIPAEDRAATAFLLAQTLTSVEGSKRDPSRARELAQKAVELYAAASGDFSPRGEEVRAWIDAEAVH
jgi:tetratricopeptide (TPR) repeat protein